MANQMSGRFVVVVEHDGHMRHTLFQDRESAMTYGRKMYRMHGRKDGYSVWLDSPQRSTSHTFGSSFNRKGESRDPARKKRIKKSRRDPASTLKRFASHDAALAFANKNLGFGYRVVDKTPGRVRLQGNGAKYTLVWPSSGRDPGKRAKDLKTLTTSQLRFLLRQRQDIAFQRLVAAELKRRKTR